MNVEELTAILRGKIRTNDAVFKLITNCYRSGSLPCMRTVSELTEFSAVVSVPHEAICLQVFSTCLDYSGHPLSLLVHLSTTFFVLLRLRVKIKECSRKLNQHGHEWTMRIDKHTIDRQEELDAFCHLVVVDRAENGETAEFNRTKDLESNPDSLAYKTNQRTLAEATGGKSFDQF